MVGTNGVRVRVCVCDKTSWWTHTNRVNYENVVLPSIVYVVRAGRCISILDTRLAERIFGTLSEIPRLGVRSHESYMFVYPR